LIEIDISNSVVIIANMKNEMFIIRIGKFVVSLYKAMSTMRF